ncbi:X-ray repair cross-complementing protein 6 [Geranomyces variabilis]|uniref:ATP-dependent DNA helicase II subunit 1 n=1 Tax=Geranomyces variabilis TaxID=109894 RepID=A0AAD5THL4_9FUNG|nr:X-ray repair cross-complementing protein 6 [Geranomyces variabilis]
MSSSWQEEFVDEEEQEELQEFGVPDRDAVIFAIDCTAPMLAVNADGTSFYTSAIRCAAKFLQNKIVQSENDLIALVLFGTDESKNEQNFNHIVEKFDLGTAEVDRILELEKIGKDPKNPGVGSSSNYSLADVFWHCSTMFSISAPRGSSKRIFLITHNDQPHAGNPTLLQNVRTRAKDLEDLGISIELFPINTANHVFDYQAFYYNLPGIRDVDDDDYDDTKVLASASDKFEILATQILRREVKKRTAFRIPWEIAPGLTIGVKGYNLVLEQKKGSHAWLDRKTNREVMPVTTYRCATAYAKALESGAGDAGSSSGAASGHQNGGGSRAAATAAADIATVGTKDFKKYWMYGGAKIVFSQEEVASMKYMCKPSLVLLGFKPRSALKDKHNVKHATFIYPDESQYSGSSSVYAHFLERLWTRQKIAICCMTPRTNAAPRLVALVPEMPTATDKMMEEEKITGLHVIYLPFADDTRHNIAGPVSVVSDEERAAATAIIKKLCIKNFTSTDYENPALQKHYNNLQALALLHDVAADIEDKTLPVTELINQRAGDLIKEFKTIVLGSAIPVATPVAAKTTKRAPARSAADGEAPAKKAKSTPTLELVKAKATEGKLSSFTVAQLTEFLKENFPSVKPAKLKGEVLEQVVAAID